MNVALVRVEPGGVDQYGDPIGGAETVIPVPGAIVAPRVAGSGTSSSELDRRGRQGVVVGRTVYLPDGTNVHRSDLVEIDGARYTIEGEIGVWKSPFTGRKPGIEVAVRRAEG